MMNSSKEAILVIGFNRPDLLENLLNLLPKSRNIYISIDGWRSESDKYSVLKCRGIAKSFQQNNSSKFVKINFSDKNLGCKLGVTYAINWVFSFEESAIILEDDICPSQDFFNFCDIGLKFFKDYQNIWQLSGWTPVHPSVKKPAAYLTRYPHIWGWATWRDRWKKYDLNLENWNSNDKISDLPIFAHPKPHKNLDFFCKNNLNDIKSGLIDTWDFQLAYSMWKDNSFSVSAGNPLCSNLGFDNRATHTTEIPTGLLGNSISIQFLPEPADWEKVFSDMLKSGKSNRYDWTHELIAFGLNKYNHQTTISTKLRPLIMKVLNFFMIKNILRKTLTDLYFKLMNLKSRRDLF